MNPLYLRDFVIQDVRRLGMSKDNAGSLHARESERKVPSPSLITFARGGDAERKNKRKLRRESFNQCVSHS
jgi:hypothetical protein